MENKKYTLGSMEIPGETEKRELSFSAMARPHQEVFADHYPDSNTVTMAETMAIFDGYFCTDKKNGKYAALLHAHKRRLILNIHMAARSPGINPMKTTVVAHPVIVCQ